MDPRTIAEQWVAHWNARDVEGVLAKFADDVVFRSHKAHEIVGNGEVRGKAALRASRMATEASTAVRVPLNSCGAMRTRISRKSRRS